MPLVKSPGFAITAILILGVGIGANTAVFSLINSTLLNPLPYPHPERLVQLFQPFRNFDRFSLDYPDYLDFRSSQRAFEGLTAFVNDDFNLAGRGEPQRISGLYVSGEFFGLLGRPFIIGRPFSENEDKADGPGVAVVSEHLWRTQFHADPNVLGTNIILNGKSFQVVGVTPAQANESAKVDVYVPLSHSSYFGTWITEQRGSHNFSCLGRLKEGVTLQQGQADLEVIRQNLVARYPVTNKSFGVRVVPYLDSVMGDYAATLWLLEAAVVCLLVITCANVANLLLARGQERRREVSIRAALGASRLGLVLQLLRESVLLAFGGAVIGVFIAAWVLNAIRRFAPSDVTRFQDVGLDGGVLVFVVIITGFTAVLSGLLPALIKSQANLGSALKKEGDRGGTAGRERHRGQALLVGGQVALTTVLLIGAGLLARSFQALQSTPLGFSPDHVLTGDIYLADTKYSTQASCQALFDALLASVKKLPGVTAVGLNSDPPFVGSTNDAFGIAGQPDPDSSQLPVAESQWVTPDYFRAVGISISQGRLFSDQDTQTSEKVVVINVSLAQRFFPGQNPIGKQLTDLHDIGGSGLKRNFYTVVGVVGDVQHNSPETQQTPFQTYYPYAQVQLPTPLNWGSLAIRTKNDPRALIPDLGKLVAAIDPNLPIANVSPFNDLIARSFATKRLATVVVTLFSGAALVLAAVGLYGILSYSVTQRKREIGVRLALGARSSSILHLVLEQGLRVVAIGLAIGIIAALALSQLISTILYGVSATDPFSISIGVLILALAALAACALPAFYATQIDPITALRE
jgi:putative ABC transport system permease protein